MNTVKSFNLRSMLRPRVLSALVAPLAAAIMMAFPTPSLAGIELSVNIAPPMIPVYEQPPLPGEGYIWTPGYWSYDQDDNDYYWVPGTWVRPPTVGYLWTPGYWAYDGGRYAFRSGYWGPHVGFYGGVNYGYGYGGRGYEGGYWNRGAFYYNRNVNSFGEFRVRNVYERPVVNVTINRISFNGGAGGIELRETQEEQRAEHERHVDQVADQQRQVAMARQNKELRASVNHGAPTIAATQKPGVFEGPGVVRAREATAEERAAATARESKVNAEKAATAKSYEPAKPARADATSNTAAGKATSVDAKTNAEAAKTARENGTPTAAGRTTSVDAKANAEAAKSAREDARAKAKAARTERQDARMKSDAAKSEKPQPNADGNGMQQDRGQRANGPKAERADRPVQGAGQGEPKARAERKAPPADSKGNDKKDENTQQK